MEPNISNTERVTLGQDGAYRWRSRVDREIEKKDYKRAMLLLLIMAIVCVGGSAIINVDFMLYVIPVAVGFFIVIGLLYFLMKRMSGKTWQRYLMNGQSIQIINTGSSVTHEFRKITQVDVYPGCLELHENSRSSRIYVALEDQTFVKDYILLHTLGNASVRDMSFRQPDQPG